MSSGTRTTATLGDLLQVDGKAKLIAGRIVHFLPTGRKPSRVAATSPMPNRRYRDGD